VGFCWLGDSEDVELDFVLAGTLPLMFKDFADVE
jgi:hypothetical protein